MDQVAVLLVLVGLTLSLAGPARADIPPPPPPFVEKYDEQIVTAAGKGELAVVQSALRRDPALATWRSIKGTAMCEAARAGHLEIVRLLFEHKAPIDGNRAIYQWTPLHCAAEKGHAEIVRFLLQHKAPVNTRSRKEETPLMLAATSCNLDTLKLILDAGAEVDAHTKGGWTALANAIESRRPECVAELLRRGAKTGGVADGSKSLKYAAQPLHLAVKQNDIQLIKTLLNAGADPNLVAPGGSTPIFDAIWSQIPLESVAALLAAKADPNRTDSDGSPPLNYATERGSKEIIELLLNNKADPNIVDKQRVTPLLRAARNHNKVVAMQLLAAGADPTILTRDRERALELLLQDMNKDAPELRPLLAKYLNKEGLPLTPIPPLQPGAGQNWEVCIQDADCDMKQKLRCRYAAANEPYKGRCQPDPSSK